jgi:type I restriction enzyme, S subunit
MTGIRPVSPSNDGAFLLASLLSRAVRDEIELRTDSGTILNALNVRSIPALRLPTTSRPEREAFHRFAAPLLNLADSLQQERLNLSRQHDELLPLLLSGRIRVRDMVA